MKTPPTGFQWAAVAFGCAFSTVLVASPQRLPVPIRTGIETAVDGVANGLLWLWGQSPEVRDQANWYYYGTQYSDESAPSDRLRNTTALSNGEAISRHTSL